MRVTTRAVYDYDGKKLYENTRLYVGTIAFLKGPSADQTALASQQKLFSQTLMNAYNTMFSAQTAIFNAVKAVFDPVIKAGMNQFGFSTAEESALRTQASEGTAQQYRNAGKSVSEQIAARGGGNSFLPSGAEAQIQSEVAGAAAESESQKQLGITEAGYEQGRQNFNEAVNAELGIASQENPLGYAGAADKATSSAFDMATEIQKMKNASSPWGAIGGLVGGIAGSFAGPFGSAIGSKLGGLLGNAGSGNNPFPGGDVSICWVAQAIYGETDPRVTSIRSYLLGDFSNTWFGRKFVGLYKKYGQKISKSKLLVNILKPLFSALLKAARRRGY